jgi:hypothetical protein
MMAIRGISDPLFGGYRGMDNPEASWSGEVQSLPTYLGSNRANASILNLSAHATKKSHALCTVRMVVEWFCDRLLLLAI